MASDMTIVEVPKPPRGRLPFLRLLARLVSNPVASWGEDFYDAPIVVYRNFGLQTVFVTDPTQAGEGDGSRPLGGFGTSTMVATVAMVP